MTYQGHVEKGCVVLDAPLSLPDGSKVEVVLLEQHANDEINISASRQKLMEFAGKFSGLPADASINLDHYLYGHAKQS